MNGRKTVYLYYTAIATPLLLWMILNPPAEALSNGDVVGWMTIWMAGSIITAAVFTFLTNRGKPAEYLLAAGIALIGSLFITVSNGAVGIMGSEDNPANLIYSAMLIGALITLGICRFEAKKLSRAMYVLAAGFAFLAIIALAGMLVDESQAEFSPFVIYMAIHTVFVLMFALPGYLFNQSEKKILTNP